MAPRSLLRELWQTVVLSYKDIPCRNRCNFDGGTKAEDEGVRMVSFHHIFHHGKERDDAERRLEIAEAHQAAEAAEAKADVATAEAQVS